MRGGGTRANHFFFFPLGCKSHFLFLADDGAGERRSEIGEDACVVPFRSQNQRPGTFYDVSNFSGLPKTWHLFWRKYAYVKRRNLLLVIRT